MDMPKDPIMLMSFVNTKLRDDFSSLEELSRYYGVSEESIISTLAAAGYVYSPEQNRFVTKF